MGTIARFAGKEEVMLGCVDGDAEQRMKAEVDTALRTGDSVGGIFEVIGHRVPPGLGTYANWDERLDAQLAAAVMSLQAVKAVEIGRGVAQQFPLARRCTMPSDTRRRRHSEWRRKLYAFHARP